jgi:hypothetical protein
MCSWRYQVSRDIAAKGDIEMTVVQTLTIAEGVQRVQAGGESDHIGDGRADGNTILRDEGW